MAEGAALGMVGGLSRLTLSRRLLTATSLAAIPVAARAEHGDFAGIPPAILTAGTRDQLLNV